MALQDPRGDRRRAPRVQARLHLSTLSEGDGSPLAMETMDISVSGAYCVVDRFVPLMTRVRLAMELPEDPPAPDAAAPCVRVVAEGIVVRVDPDPGSLTFRLALFFSALEGDGRDRLEVFVRRQRDRGREI